MWTAPCCAAQGTGTSAQAVHHLQILSLSLFVTHTQLIFFTVLNLNMEYIAGVLREHVLAVIRQEVGYNLDMSPVYHRASANI